MASPAMLVELWLFHDVAAAYSGSASRVEVEVREAEEGSWESQRSCPIDMEARPKVWGTEWTLTMASTMCMAVSEARRRKRDERRTEMKPF